MIGILDKKSRSNKKGQVMIFNLVILIMTIVVFVGLLPVLSDTIYTAKDQGSLNCKSNDNKCATNQAVPCYNSSIPTSTMACAMMDLYVPYIVIIVLIAGVMKLIANRLDIGVGQQAQPMYQGY